jgi:hydrogenase-4 component H
MTTTLGKLMWILKLPYLPEVFKAAFRGPYTVDFPFGETFDTGAYRGATVWDEDVCIGCGACQEVCPADAIEMIDDTAASPPVRRFKLRYDKCIFCGHCHYHCTTEDGIYQSTEWDLATYDRTQSFTTVEKELVLCGHCGEVVAPKDHILWVARKMGPKAYANPGLALTLEGQLITAPQPEGAAAEQPDRADIMRVLCPHCRRVVVLTEIA